MKNWLKKSACFSKNDRYLRTLARLEEFWIFILARVRETHVREVTSTMTLTTLISLVPMIAVSLSAFALFPGFADNRKELEDAIFHSFLPAQYSGQIVEYLREFSSHASGLGIVGVIALTFTTLLLVNKLFMTINAIFKVHRLRSWGQRALLYWALITLGPIFIAFSLTMSTHIIRTAAMGIAPGMVTELLQVAQILLQCVGFSLVFKLVPNCHVPYKHALIGGLIVSVFLWLMRAFFEIYVTRGSLSTIYGAFVAFPILILWMYYSWYIVFIGAAVTSTIPLLTGGRFADYYRVGDQFLTGVAILKCLTEARAAHEPMVPLKTICKVVDTYPQGALDILEKLSEAGYCAPIAREHGLPDWALIGNPDELTLERAADTLLIDRSNLLIHSDGRHSGYLKDWFDDFNNEASIKRSLTELFGPKAHLAEKAAQ